ncbi:ATP-binding protein [Actinomadura sp. NBRC 104425]|uniref:ATP-binding protein n=1 Tax=Actinomadura sp. NBRC 104425 TaxID=3032204 RepID=UPI0024A50292|nr:ATP-binding protein [Actinomadura sp. NBRC 104425]GLZ14054.1 ATP-binding protein [Actinomadura sp. NBRC 104425]
MEWTQTYPGLPSMVPAIRVFVRSLLGDTPRADDAELVVCELAANSLRHTPSGGDGGKLTVAVTVRTGYTRLAVTDSGDGGWSRPGMPDETAEYGRGLLIVEACADNFGHVVDTDGQTMWAEFIWRDS